jgi:hypothetical protein
MTTKTWTEWTVDQLVEEFAADPERAARLVEFHAAGKMILVYENHDLGHPEMGHTIAVTWYEDELPPVDKSCPYELPAGLMHWRYYPKAVVRP